MIIECAILFQGDSDGTRRRLDLFRGRLTAIGFDTIGNTPEQFAAQIRSDIARWGKVIREAGIKAD